MASRPDQPLTTVWQTVFWIASSRQETKSGKHSITKKAESVIEAYHDAEIEDMVEDAMKNISNKRFVWPD